MKAIVKTRPGPGAEYVEVETPCPGAGEVLIRVKACAICGTDVHIYRWNAWARRTVPKIFGDKPRIMGHEFCGEVVEVGSSVRMEGDRP
ncbi:MAG: alcohol dehydrogenase catalytic domain-containing protein [candidate division NC10 bacterium]|nr:alcohol dehydrogenase catalytic domain-containing protein [candidate division NC10 bacterium]